MMFYSLYEFWGKFSHIKMMHSSNNRFTNFSAHYLTVTRYNLMNDKKIRSNHLRIKLCGLLL